MIHEKKFKILDDCLNSRKVLYLGQILTLATNGHPRFHFFVESKEDLLHEMIFRHRFELHNRTKHKHNPC